MGAESLSPILGKLIESSIAFAVLLLLLWFMYDQLKKMTIDRDLYRDLYNKCQDGKIAENERLKEQIKILEEANRNLRKS